MIQPRKNWNNSGANNSSASFFALAGSPGVPRKGYFKILRSGNGDGLGPANTFLSLNESAHGPVATNIAFFSLRSTHLQFPLFQCLHRLDQWEPRQDHGANQHYRPQEK